MLLTSQMLFLSVEKFFFFRWSGHKAGQRNSRIFSPETKAEAVVSYHKNGLRDTCDRFVFYIDINRIDLIQK